MPSDAPPFAPAPHDRRRSRIARWRPAAGALLGVGLGLALPGTVAERVLLGWNAAALVYLALTFWLMATATKETIKAHGREADERRPVLMILILAAIGISIASLFVVLIEGRNDESKPAIVALAFGTLVVNWVFMHILFAQHYAHRFFGDENQDGELNGGLDFPGEPPEGYAAMVYFAFCIGLTYQTSDVDIGSNRMRNLVSVHALLSFVFNTVILAIAINIAGSSI